MNLIELIKQHASESATVGDYSAVAATLNAVNVDVIDSTYYTSRYLVTLLGVDNYRIVSGSLAAIGEMDPLVKDIHQTLNTTGVDFSTPLTQSMIDQLGAAASWPQELIDTLKAIGRSQTSLALKELGVAVTAEQCEAAWMKSYLSDWLENARGNALGKIQSGEISTLETLKTFLGN